MPNCRSCPNATDETMEEIPMNRYANPIPVCHRRQEEACPIRQEGLDHILTALSFQNQLLIDLLGAINGLSAILLSERK